MERWEKYGVSGKQSLLGVLCNDRAQKLVAHFRQNEQASSAASLYCRSYSSKQYERLTKEDDMYTYEDPVSSPVSPYVYANLSRCDPHPKEPRSFVLAWQSLVRISLETKAQETIVDEQALLKMVNGEDPYVSHVFGVGYIDSTESIICGISWQVRTGNSHSAEYGLYRLLPSSGALQKLGPILGTAM